MTPLEIANLKEENRRLRLIESDGALEEIARLEAALADMTAARDEACSLASCRTCANDLDRTRIAELRRVGK